METTRPLSCLAAAITAYLAASAHAELTVAIERGILVPTEDPILANVLPKPDDEEGATTFGGPAQLKLPAEWSNFTPTDVQNPSANFVGTLLVKGDDGKFSSTSEPIFLAEKACKGLVTIDNTKDDVYTHIEKVSREGGFELLGLIKIGAKQGQAVKLALSRISSAAPTSGFDYAAISRAKQQLKPEQNKKKYWLCTGQEVFSVTSQVFSQGQATGNGTYTLVKIGTELFRETDSMKKFYTFRLKRVLLEDFIVPATPTPSPSPAAVNTPGVTPTP